VKAFANILSAFENIDAVTISTLLGPSFEPAEGLVNNLAFPDVSLWKRGAGDRVHPWLNLIQHDGPFDNLIHTCQAG
jgi:hypothetical protein